MIKRLLISVLFLLIAGTVTHAQVTDQRIGLTRSGFLFKHDSYVKCDVEMNHEQLLRLLLKDPNMEKYARPLTVNFVTGNLLWSAGTVLVVLPVIDQVFDRADPNWNLAWIGGACLAAAIPFKLGFQRQARKAIAYYNSGYREADGMSLNLQTGPNGIGLVCTF